MQIKLNINGILFVTFSLLQNSIQVILIHYIPFLHTNHIYISLLEDTKLCSVRQCKTSQQTLILSPTAYMYDKCTQVGNLKFLSKNFNFIHIFFKSLAITCTLYHNNAILSYFFLIWSDRVVIYLIIFKNVWKVLLYLPVSWWFYLLKRAGLTLFHCRSPCNSIVQDTLCQGSLTIKTKIIICEQPWQNRDC